MRPVEIDPPFHYLAADVHASNCGKKKIICGTYVNGCWIVRTNRCEFAGNACPRIHLPTGQGYELCTASHAEARLAEVLKTKGLISDGIAWVFGHYYACEPCASALKAVGVTEIRVREMIA